MVNLTTPEEESELLSALARAYRESPFWRARLSDHGIAEKDFVLGFPFQDLPLLTKADILVDQAENPPFGKLLAVSPERIRRVHKTSGTSATPLFIALTERDVEDTWMASRRAFKTAGMGPGDRVVHCLNFNMWSGGVTDYLPIEQVGATGIPYGVGSTSMLMHTIRVLGVNAISSTPSYMYTLRDRCRDELGLDPRELGLRRGYFGGEGLLQVPGVREEIEETFGMTAMDANYGMSEVLSIIGGEGPERNGLIYHGHGVLYAELIDGSGRSIPVEEGAEGELVLSTLRREAQPLFRYLTNDVVRILWAEPAEDGLLRMRFSVVGRSDEMLVVKGVNFFPQSLASVITEFEPKVGHDFRVVRPKGAEPEELRVVLETDVPPGPERDVLGADFRARAAATFQVRFAVEWRPKGALEPQGNKTRFLVNDIKDI